MQVENENHVCVLVSLLFCFFRFFFCSVFFVRVVCASVWRDKYTSVGLLYSKAFLIVGTPNAPRATIKCSRSPRWLYLSWRPFNT